MLGFSVRLMWQCAVFVISIQFVSSSFRNILEEGGGYVIFKPFSSNAVKMPRAQLISPPEQWIKHYSNDMNNLKRQVTLHDSSRIDDTEKARKLYLEMLIRLLTGLCFGEEDIVITAGRGELFEFYHPNPAVKIERTRNGSLWPGFSVTMVGEKRLRNIYSLLMTVFDENIPGDYIETGVWKGGASIFARAVMRSYKQSHRRSFVCDSFKGLPPSVLKEDPLAWDNVPLLEQSENTVIRNFHAHGIVDDRIIFVKGFFNNTLRPVRSRIDKLSVIRFDGDMYQSAVDMLYLLYDKLSIGGYVIMDDWFGFPSQQAVHDFFAAHEAPPPVLIAIDGYSAYWKKTSNVHAQMWRYEQRIFTGNKLQ